MSQIATAPITFDCSADRVFAALCDLDRLPLWNSGLLSVSRTGVMTEGLQYETVRRVLGHNAKSAITVMSLNAPHRVVLASRSRLISFHLTYVITALEPTRCTVACQITFQFSNLVFHLAQPAAEAVAGEQITADLERLRTLLAQSDKNN